MPEPACSLLPIQFIFHTQHPDDQISRMTGQIWFGAIDFIVNQTQCQAAVRSVPLIRPTSPMPWLTGDARRFVRVSRRAIRTQITVCHHVPMRATTSSPCLARCPDSSVLSPKGDDSSLPPHNAVPIGQRPSSISACSLGDSDNVGLQWKAPGVEIGTSTASMARALTGTVRPTGRPQLAASLRLKMGDGCDNKDQISSSQSALISPVPTPALWLHRRR
ncbi:hypothetical protein VTI74DRAFT_4922 [Chaetomium olivicolor]